MKKKGKQLSPAIQLIDLIWEKSFRCKPHSWNQFNASLQDALELAIKSGMVFDLNDFQYISDTYRFSYWAGNDGHMQGERYYALSVRGNNMKAVQSFEAWKNRKPFIFRNVKSKYFMPTERKKCRLFAGSEFEWMGEWVKITSFSKDGTYLVACSYKEKPEGDYPTEKIKCRYKITNSDLKKELKWLKKCDVFEAGLKYGSTFRDWIIDLFNVSVPENKRTRDCFFRMVIRD